jgi:hypothetical protein
MAYFVSPIGNSQFIDANGDPLIGGKVHTYLAGSTTPAATYTDNTGSTPQANPIILNALGAPASPIWLGEGIAYKFVVKDADDVTLSGLGGDNIEGVNDAATSASEWVESGYVPTYLSATTFSVPGDQTDTLLVGRRLRTTNTAGLRYSSITVSAFAAGITTVTVVNDSGTLDSGLSLVAYGLLSPLPMSIPFLATLSAKGSYTFPGGLIVKWGNVVTSGVGDVGDTFTTAFPASLYAVTVSPVDAGGSANIVASLGAVSTTAVNIGAYVGSTGARATATVYYFAIGR